MPSNNIIDERTDALLTHNTHLPDNDAADVFCGRNLCFFTKDAAHERAYDELHTLASVHGVDVRLCSFWVGNEAEDVSENVEAVSLQPRAAHALAKLYIRLKSSKNVEKNQTKQKTNGNRKQQAGDRRACI